MTLLETGSQCSKKILGNNSCSKSTQNGLCRKGVPSPWAGAPKGFDSNWHVTILDALGNKLASVPLDVRPFATGANSVGKPGQVRGCVVVDSKIGMLVNVPAYAAAASYVFARTEVDGVVTTLGTTSGDVIRELARGGR